MNNTHSQISNETSPCMDWCALESHKNIFKTLFYPIKVLSYMQKHKILEIISELMIRIGIERPSNGEIIDFMIIKLIEIAKKFKRSDIERNTMKIEFHNCCNVGMLRELSMKLHIPLVECCECCYSDKKVVRAKLCKRHLIICEFSDKSPPEKDHKCDSTLKKLKYLIPNIRIMRDSLSSNICWNKRVLFVGRIGSGRKTQASLFAYEFGLNLIDCDRMIREYEHTSGHSCNMAFWGFMQETILKPDYLCNGYAIVSNVISKEALSFFMEKFIHPPNQIIFIHVSENKCRRRILRRHERILSSYRGIISPLSSLSATADLHALLNYHMDQYNLHKKDFIRTMRDRIYHVNGNGSVNDTKTSIWAHLARCKNK